METHHWGPQKSQSEAKSPVVSGSYFVRLENIAVDQAQGPEQNTCREEKDIFIYTNICFKSVNTDIKADYTNIGIYISLITVRWLTGCLQTENIELVL